MIEVAEKLIEAMEAAIEGKRAGLPGNYQGILNKIRNLFETTFAEASGQNPALTPYISKARHLQLEGSRLASRSSRKEKGIATAPVGYKVSLADAFEYQKKSRLNRNAVEDAPTPKATTAPQQVRESEPEQVAVEPEGQEEEVVDTDLAASLAKMKAADFRAHFGGMEGIRAFAKEVYGMEQGEETDSRFITLLKAKLKG